MNIVFWALVVILAFLVWLGLSSCFWNIGEFFSDLWNEAREAMEETDEFKEDEENE